MKSFFKTFFATLLALMVFSVIIFLVFVAVISVAVSSDKDVAIETNSVLTVDLSNPLLEQTTVNPFNVISRRGDVTVLGLHDVVTAIRDAAGDQRIQGIYLKLNGDPNGLATNSELRRALLDFKKSGKFIYAYGSMVSQKAYYVATAADKIYLNPAGGLDFAGFSTQMPFLKGTLDKLDIQPQIFYEGKYKSATEPFRVTQMTPANKEQTANYLGDLYHHFLQAVSAARKIDTAALFRDANEDLIQTPYDAEKFGLVDELKYHDQVMSEIRKRLNLTASDKIRFISMSKYTERRSPQDIADKNRIAVLYAQGDIVSGHGSTPGQPSIASEDYIRMIRKIREDSSIKALVLRVNSPGGSALAADEIWRELLLTKQVKPVVVSMGDYAASGGYYISCMADSIFAEASTLTGSIGVFAIIPNLQSFFKNKLGVTFDGVKTAEYADMGTITRPLTPAEQKFIQAGIDTVYATFRHRVEKGRNLSPAVVDSIAQGRVWSGSDALGIGLVDRIGGLQAAVRCAARLSHSSSYSLKQYPEPEAPFRLLIDQLTGEIHTHAIKEELGSRYATYMQLKRIVEGDGEIMARLPFDIVVN